MRREILDLGDKVIIGMQRRLFRRHRVDPARGLEAVHQRLLHEGRQAVGIVRLGVEFQRAVGLRQGDTISVQPAGHIGTQDRQRPAHLFAAAGGEGGAHRIDRPGIGRAQAQQVAAAGRQAQRRSADQEKPPLDHRGPHLGSYPLRRSPNNSLVGWRLNWSEASVRLATSRRISPTRSDTCARPSPLMKASASSATLPYFCTVRSTWLKVGRKLFVASLRLAIALLALAMTASMSALRRAITWVVSSRLARTWAMARRLSSLSRSLIRDAATFNLATTSGADCSNWAKLDCLVWIIG